MLAAVITEGLDAEKSWIHQHINIYPPKLPQLPTSLSSLGLHYQQNKVWNSPSSVTHNKLPCLVPMPLIGTRTWNIVNVNAIKQLKLSRTSLIRSIVYFKQPLYIVERVCESCKAFIIILVLYAYHSNIHLHLLIFQISVGRGYIHYS